MGLVAYWCFQRSPSSLQGSTLHLSTAGQQSLPDTLAAHPHLSVRVTGLDKDSKLQILSVGGGEGRGGGRGRVGGRGWRERKEVGERKEGE